MSTKPLVAAKEVVISIGESVKEYTACNREGAQEITRLGNWLRVRVLSKRGLNGPGKRYGPARGAEQSMALLVQLQTLLPVFSRDQVCKKAGNRELVGLMV
ncbi:hypothetical protein CDL15_Pgr002869 [Punica granatum]|uniref:Uncharacterized protein n=1 Tax=Punica granatum TaxID=22663 RepID=A0A218X1J9_PUNGR|nr:hypothetical protein CDL15_Pgr002869 [Punica granatum]